MADESALFEELIGIQFDIQQFKNSLDQLGQAYQEKLDEFPDLASAIKTADLDSFVQRMESSLVIMKDGFDSFREGFEGTTEKAETANEAIAKSTEKAVDRQIEALGRLTEAQAEANQKPATDAEQASWSKDNQLEIEKLQIAARNNQSIASSSARSTQGVALKSGNEEDAARANAAVESVAKIRLAYQELQEAIERMDMVAARGAAELIEKNTAVARSIEETSKSGGLSGWLSALGEGVLQMGKWQLEWAAISVVIEGIGKVLASPIEAFRQGSQYIEKMQQDTDELTGVIAGTVRYTNDMTTNLRESRVAAEAVVVQLRQVAAADHLPFDNLQRAFKSLADNGAGTMVKNMRDLVGVTEIFGLAIQASGKSVEGTRSLISQIPKLMSDNVTGSEALLYSLGITKEKWSEIRAEAQKNGDLYDQLKGKSEALRAAAAEWKDSQATVTAELKEDFSVMEAFFARALWEKLAATLKTVRDYLAQHREVLQGIATVLGDVVLHLANALAIVAKSFFDLGNDGKVPPMLAFVIKMAFELDKLAVHIEAVGKLWSSVTDRRPDFDIKPGMTDEQKQQVVSKTEAEYNAKPHPTIRQISDDEVKQVAALDVKEQAAIKGEPGALGNKTDALGHSLDSLKEALDKEFTPTRNPPESKAHYNRDELSLDKEKYSGEKQGIEDNTSSDIATIDASVKAGKESAIDASDEKIAAYAAEKQALDALIQKYQALAASIKGAKPVDIQKFQQSLSNQKAHLDQELDNKSTVEQGNGEQILRQQAEADSKAQIKLVQDEANAEISVVKERVKTKQQSESQGFEQTIALQKREHDEVISIYSSQVEQYGTLTKAGQDAAHKIQEANAAYVAAHANDTATILALVQKEIDAHKKMQEELRALQLQEQEESIRHQQALGANPISIGKQQIALQQTVVSGAQQNQQTAQNKLSEAQDNYASNPSVANQAKLDDASQRLEKFNLAVEQATNKLQELQAKSSTAGALGQNIFGSAGHMDQDGMLSSNPFSASYKDNGDGSTSKVSSAFDNTVGSLNKSFQFFDNSAKNIINGFKNGGILGGISGIADTIAQAFGQNSVVGQIAGLVSGIASLFSSIFSAQAIAIEQKFAKDLKDTMTSYSQQNATLAQTIQALQQQEAQFISQESGQKGGQAQIDKLKPQYDSQINSLQQQQQQILTQFNQQVSQLNLQTSQLGNPLGQALQTWQQINTQVTQYLQAGGQIANAQSYMNAQLKQLQQTAQAQLTQGQTQAVQDALQLNSLLQQRITLEQNYSKTVFGELNKDSLERRSSNAVTTGMDVKQQTSDYVQQASDLNNQITTSQKKVSLESQVYQIANTTAGLQAQSGQLQIQQLQQQLSLAQQYAQVYNGIYKDSSGNYKMTSGLSQQIGTVNINLQNPTTVTADQLASAISSSVATRARSGLGTSLPRYNS